MRTSERRDDTSHGRDRTVVFDPVADMKTLASLHDLLRGMPRGLDIDTFALARKMTDGVFGQTDESRG